MLNNSGRGYLGIFGVQLNANDATPENSENDSQNECGSRYQACFHRLSLSCAIIRRVLPLSIVERAPLQKTQIYMADASRELQARGNGGAHVTTFTLKLAALSRNARLNAWFCPQTISAFLEFCFIICRSQCSSLLACTSWKTLSAATPGGEENGEPSRMGSFV
jgi:hypothetical protein